MITRFDQTGAARRPGYAGGFRGFTLVELLTVIAIIAVLAGLLFPVLARAQRGARQGQCMSNMKVIIQALRMYKDDWRVYPEAMFGYGIDLNDDGLIGPGDLHEPRLFPEYVNDERTFTCPVALQQRGNQTWVTAGNQATNEPNGRVINGQFFPFMYPAFSSYDVELDPGNPTTGVLRYSRKWTPSVMTGLTDFPRQLIYKNPPDNTVVTWCNHHVEWSGGVPQHGAMSVVGFLSGRVQTIPADQMVFWPNAHGQFPFEAMPKP